MLGPLHGLPMTTESKIMAWTSLCGLVPNMGHSQGHLISSHSDFCLTLEGNQQVS